MIFPAEAEPEPAPESWRENVAAVVMDAAGRVLLGLGCGSNAYWHFPQGGVGSKETLPEALRRELWEEARLSPGSYRILAAYGGLRYRYRKNNDKSGRWRGQEQTWFFVLCHGEMPVTDCSHTDEFSALTWVPWRELAPELFAPAKRKVVEKVLATFFPQALRQEEVLRYVQQELTPQRYRMAGRALENCPAGDRALCGGGKEEMVSTLARLGLSLRAAHKTLAATRSRLLVLIHGAAGSGRRQCLRRLASSLEPLRLRCAELEAATRGLPWELLAQLPQPGELTLALSAPTAADWPACEQWFMAQGIRVLKLYLHMPEDTDAADLLAATDTADAPWYIIPAERRWYRDYVVASLVVSALSGDFPEGI